MNFSAIFLDVRGVIADFCSMLNLSRRRVSAYMAAGLVLGAWCVPAKAQLAGSLDAGFLLTRTLQDQVFTVAPAKDGNVVLGGELTQIDGVQLGPIYRVHSDGSLDTGFVPPRIQSYDTLTDSIITATNPNFKVVVFTTAVQSDDKVLVGGAFFFVNGKPGYGGLIRLNSDGSIDTSFQAPRFSGSVYAVVPLSNGQVLVGGDFSYINTTKSNALARLNADGTLDTSFAPGNFAGTPPDSNPVSTYPTVHAIVVQPDGKVIIGGVFTSIGGTSRRAIARLNTDGSVDTGFVPDPAFNPPAPNFGNDYSVDQVLTMALQSDGKIVVGGSFRDPSTATALNPTPVTSVYRLNPDGSLDGSFNPGGAGTAYKDPNFKVSNELVNAVVLQADGKIIIGGPFLGYDGVPANLIARLNTDGTLDSSFDVGTGPVFNVNALALQADAKLLVGGTFTSVDGVTRPYVARFNTVADAPPGVVVGIAATKKRAYESDQTKGKFTVTRTGGNLDSRLTVKYTVSGPAMPGVDYAQLSGTVKIRSGQTSAVIKVIPLGSTLATDGEKVTVTIVPNAAYGLAPKSSASVILANQVPIPAVL